MVIISTFQDALICSTFLGKKYQQGFTIFSKSEDNFDIHNC
jgi:hypothetical protein